MLEFFEFKTNAFGNYNVLIHTSKDEACQIMAFFGHRDLLPDFLPLINDNEPNKEQYLFLLNSDQKIIVPLWSYTYPYGGGWNGYGPVGSAIKDFEFNLFDYSYRHFNDREIRQCQGEIANISEWPDAERCGFNIGQK